MKLAMTVSKETVELLPHAGHNSPAIAKQKSRRSPRERGRVLQG